jgi:hypothetical protein
MADLLGERAAAFAVAGVEGTAIYHTARRICCPSWSVEICKERRMEGII